MLGPGPVPQLPKGFVRVAPWAGGWGAGADLQAKEGTEPGLGAPTCATGSQVVELGGLRGRPAVHRYPCCWWPEHGRVLIRGWRGELAPWRGGGPVEERLSPRHRFLKQGLGALA